MCPVDVPQLWKSLYDFMEKSHAWTEDPILDESSRGQMDIESIRAEVGARTCIGMGACLAAMGHAWQCAVAP